MTETTKREDFIRLIESEFENDRLTYQKSIATFHPETAEEVSQFIKLANKNFQKLFITGYGNNVDPIGETFQSMISIRTDRLNDILELSPDNFFVRVGSGYPLRELNKELKQKELFLPHSNLPYVGSVGGALAVGLSAEYHQQDFPLKKYFIECTMVTPEGDIIRPGSVCFKSVSGYDITRIFSGSWGLLGLIVSATFRVMPETAENEFLSMKQKEINRDNFLAGLSESNQEADAIYSRKIKDKFDPLGIFPIVTQ